MEESSVVHNTFVIERSYPVPPEKVFAAFADPVSKRRWYAEGVHHDVEEYEMDFRVGGSERYRSRFKEGTPFPGVALMSEGVFNDLVENRRVVISATMSLGDKRISATLVTIELMKTEAGTDLLCTHQGAFFEGADGPQIREMGWRTLFDKLGAELERE